MQWTGARRTALENYMWAHGISQVQFVTEMNKHLDVICDPSNWNHWHSEAFFDRVLEIQVNFMFHELATSENFYMFYISHPSNRNGVAGATAYAELFCALVLRPGAGTGTINNIQDPGVREALRESQFVGGPGVLDRVSFSRLDERRNEAEYVYWRFLSSHG